MLGKKATSLVLAAILSLTALGGCSSNAETPSATESSSTESSSSTTSSAGESGAGYKLPIANNDVTLTIMGRENSSPTAPTYASGELPVWNKIQELTGVNLEFDCVISADYEKTVQTRLASGQDLPDILTIPDPVPYIATGMFEPLNDLIDQYAPDVKRVLDENYDVKAAVSDSDGTIYCVPTVPKDVNKIHTKILFIRQDWLDRLNLEVPETMDDWYNVLKAFKEEDADGDGDPNNEIPMMVPSQDEIWDVRSFCGAFNVEMPYAKGYSIKDGQAYYAFDTEEGRAFVEFMNKCWTEGLLENRASADARSAFSAGQVGAIEDFPDGIVAPMNLLTEGNPDAAVSACPFPTTEYCPEGRSVSPYNAYEYNAAGFITSSSENKEVAMQFLNFLYSEEGTLLCNFGVEGEQYTMENGEPVITEYYTNNPDGLNYSDAQREIGARPGFPYIYSRSFEEQCKSLDPVIESTIPLIEKVSAPPTMPSVLPTQEEANELKMLQADFDTYVAENLTMLIQGDIPMSEYDNFVTGLYDMGLEDILAIKQAQYDRYVENQK